MVTWSEHHLTALTEGDGATKKESELLPFLASTARPLWVSARTSEISIARPNSSYRDLQNNDLRERLKPQSTKSGIKWQLAVLAGD